MWIVKKLIKELDGDFFLKLQKIFNFLRSNMQQWDLDGNIHIEWHDRSVKENYYLDAINFTGNHFLQGHNLSHKEFKHFCMTNKLKLHEYLLQ